MTPLDELLYLVESELLGSSMPRAPRGMLRRIVAALAGVRERSLSELRWQNGSIVAQTTERQFIKIPVASSSTGWREPAAWELARREPAFADLVVAGEVRRTGPLLALVTPLLRKPPSGAAAIDDLLARLATSSHRAPLSGADLPEVDDGLRALQRTAPALVAHARGTVAALRTREVSIGPMHGDAHAGNAVVDDEGRPRLVDCGDLRRAGLPALDAIHARVEAAAVRAGLSWPWIVRDLARATGPLPDDAGVDEWRTLYALYRLAGAFAASPRTARKIGATIFGTGGAPALR